MADVFLSYATEDRERARFVAEAFDRQGWSVWWDRSIDAGESFGNAIKVALAGARCVVVLWSKDSIDSDWVKDEASSGKKRGILVPASLDGSDPPLGFQQLQTASLVGWHGAADDAGFVLLRDGVAAKVSGTPPINGDKDGYIDPPPPRIPRIAVASGICAILGAVLLFAALLVTDNIHRNPIRPDSGERLAQQLALSAPALHCTAWPPGKEKGDPNPFKVGVAAACTTEEVVQAPAQAPVPELDLYLFGSVGGLSARDLRDAFWGDKIYTKGILLGTTEGGICVDGTCGCPTGFRGEGAFAEPGSDPPPRISCGYAPYKQIFKAPELRWTSGEQLYARIVYWQFHEPADPAAGSISSPAPSPRLEWQIFEWQIFDPQSDAPADAAAGSISGPAPSPGPESASPAPDQHIMDLYAWWQANHKLIEDASAGVVD